MIKTIETKMPSSCVKIHTKHQSRHTGHQTLIMHSLTLSTCEHAVESSWDQTHYLVIMLSPILPVRA